MGNFEEKKVGVAMTKTY